MRYKEGESFKWSGWAKPAQFDEVTEYTIYSGNWARRKWWKRIFWKPWVKLIDANNEA